MRKSFAFILCFVLITISCDKNNSTTPTRPKPKASIQLDLIQGYSWREWFYWRYNYHVIFYIIVSEHNGVGGEVTTCKVERYDDEKKLLGSNPLKGGIFAPFGTIEIESHLVFGSISEIREIRAVVEGVDNNGYSFKAQKSLWY